LKRGVRKGSKGKNATSNRHALPNKLYQMNL